jgi:CRP-like cAMP-binding protein
MHFLIGNSWLTPHCRSKSLNSGIVAPEVITATYPHRSSSWHANCYTLPDLVITRLQGGQGSCRRAICPKLGHMTLEHASFTVGMAKQHLAKLATLGHDVRFEEDQIILLAGQRSTHFCLLLSGSVCVEVRTAVYTVCIQVLRPGEAFGWSSFLNHQDTLFQVCAREPSTGICWDGSRLSVACREDSELGLELFRRLLELAAGRVKATESKLAEFCGVPALISADRSD